MDISKDCFERIKKTYQQWANKEDKTDGHDDFAKVQRNRFMFQFMTEWFPTLLMEVEVMDHQLEMRDQAAERARRVYREKHGTLVWPDLSDNIVWLVEFADGLAKENEELRRKR